MIVDAGLFREAAVLFLAPPRKRDQRDILAIEPLSHPASKLVPVHARHPDIQQHDGGPVRRERLERRRSIIS